ncbi:phosphotransferase [Amycolatopsis acidicola]|uniref:Phosphotransferase n=1 Tax=Amycolatopsis acidicola TaxID=2596893 RepID=A0A5N0V565_9PSEU|nr:phosphotransferase [Amycolatopsis acidicola]KAA9160518.1 phosphotransferase [Amycolatopsis acidicola]
MSLGAKVSSVKEQAQRVLEIAKVGGHVLEERIGKSVPTSLAEVPSSVQRLSTEWLSAALCADAPGARVISFELGDHSHGSTTRDRIRIRYNEPGRAAGLPGYLFVKSSPGFTSRLVNGLSGALESEAGFYRELRPKVDMNSPGSYHISLDTKSFRSVYLLEDVAESKGAEFGNPVTMYVDRPMAESMVRNLAAYHGRFWQDEILSTAPWLQSSLQFQERVNDAIDFEKRTLVGVERGAGIVPREFLERRGEIWPSLMHSLRVNVSGPHTLLHSDMHIGNWYRDRDGGMGLYDWQCMSHGGWALDVVYALTSALRTEDRRAWEKDLLRLYLRELAAHGGQPPEFERAWDEYRLQIFHALVFWLYTIGSGRFQPKMQKDDVTAENVRRMAQATIDFGSFDL